MHRAPVEAGLSRISSKYRRFTRSYLREGECSSRYTNSERSKTRRTRIRSASRNRRRDCECRAELSKYAAARPLFALRAGRMAASGIICRGRHLGSDVALTRAPKVPPKIVGPLRGGMIFGGTCRRELLYSHARGTSPNRGRLTSHHLFGAPLDPMSELSEHPFYPLIRSLLLPGGIDTADSMTPRGIEDSPRIMHDER